MIVMGVLWLAGSPQPYLLGALAGCFLFNWPRAKHFLGDCGSLTIGLMLAILTFKTLGHQRPSAFLWIFAYPALDVVMVIAIRAWNRCPLGQGDRSHLHHQLVDKLLAMHFMAVPCLWLLAGGAAYGCMAMSFGVMMLSLVALMTLLVIITRFALLSRPKLCLDNSIGSHQKEIFGDKSFPLEAALNEEYSHVK